MGIEPDQAELFPEIDGRSPAVRRLKHHMRRVARDAHVTVLILGESGTGKERVARAIHRASPRQRAPFIVVNCAALSPGLVEDELFGHVKGAFTGAVDDRPGPFERANGGTLFLDEVGDLSLEVQKKLLRALQQRTVQRLGGRQETAFDVRVIAATNVDLAAARSQGRFRDDLYYRLRVYEVNVPPLRRRGADDVGALATALLGSFAERRRRAAKMLDADTLDRLVSYRWPGNVRELENTLEYMIVAADGDLLLRPEHLPEDFARCEAIAPQGPFSGGLAAAPRRFEPLPPAARVAAALERHAFRHGRAARELGLSRHQLYRLVKRYAIRVPRSA
jgi:transcriptional regulator with GAF, ATPase, and Fis domain